MRYNELNESEFLTNEDEIIEYIDKMFLGKALNKVDMNQLKIKPDGLTYDGSLSLRINVSELQVQFKSIAGYFDCNYCMLTTLKGFPDTIGGDLLCNNDTSITSLKFFPKSIVGSFYFQNNRIKDPKEFRYALYCEIGGEFISDSKEIDNIINTYGGAANRKYWPSAINLLSKVQL